MHGEKLKLVVSVNFLLSYAESLHLCCPRVGKADPKGKQAILSESEHRRYEKNKSSPLRTSLCWEPPEHDWVKVNVDGAFDQLTGHAGIGIIICDSSGKPELCAWKSSSDGLNAEEIEALACLEGARLAVQYTGDKVIIESDCATVIAATLKPGKNRSQLAFIMEELKHASSVLAEVRYIAVRREQNVVAHELARLVKCTTHSVVWRMQVPQCVESLIVKDCNMFMSN
jgi:ribonuclease HI